MKHLFIPILLLISNALLAQNKGITPGDTTDSENWSFEERGKYISTMMNGYVEKRRSIKDLIIGDVYVQELKENDIKFEESHSNLTNLIINDPRAALAMAESVILESNLGKFTPKDKYEEYIKLFFEKGEDCTIEGLSFTPPRKVLKAKRNPFCDALKSLNDDQKIILKNRAAIEEFAIYHDEMVELGGESGQIAIFREQLAVKGLDENSDEAKLNDYQTGAYADVVATTNFGGSGVSHSGDFQFSQDMGSKVINRYADDHLSPLDEDYFFSTDHESETVEDENGNQVPKKVYKFKAADYEIKTNQDSFDNSVGVSENYIKNVLDEEVTSGGNLGKIKTDVVLDNAKNEKELIEKLEDLYNDRTDFKKSIESFHLQAYTQKDPRSLEVVEFLLGPNVKDNKFIKPEEANFPEDSRALYDFHELVYELNKASSAEKPGIESRIRTKYPDYFPKPKNDGDPEAPVNNTTLDKIKKDYEEALRANLQIDKLKKLASRSRDNKLDMDGDGKADTYRYENAGLTRTEAKNILKAIEQYEKPVDKRKPKELRDPTKFKTLDQILEHFGVKDKANKLLTQDNESIYDRLEASSAYLKTLAEYNVNERLTIEGLQKLDDVHQKWPEIASLGEEATAMVEQERVRAGVVISQEFYDDVLAASVTDYPSDPPHYNIANLAAYQKIRNGLDIDYRNQAHDPLRGNGTPLQDMGEYKESFNLRIKESGAPVEHTKILAKKNPDNSYTYERWNDNNQDGRIDEGEVVALKVPGEDREADGWEILNKDGSPIKRENGDDVPANQSVNSFAGAKAPDGITLNENQKYQPLAADASVDVSSNAAIPSVEATEDDTHSITDLNAGITPDDGQEVVINGTVIPDSDGDGKITRVDAEVVGLNFPPVIGGTDNGGVNQLEEEEQPFEPPVVKNICDSLGLGNEDYAVVVKQTGASDSSLAIVAKNASGDSPSFEYKEIKADGTVGKTFENTEIQSQGNIVSGSTILRKVNGKGRIEYELSSPDGKNTKKDFYEFDGDNRCGQKYSEVPANEPVPGVEEGINSGAPAINASSDYGKDCDEVIAKGFSELTKILGDNPDLLTDLTLKADLEVLEYLDPKQKDKGKSQFHDLRNELKDKMKNTYNSSELDDLNKKLAKMESPVKDCKSVIEDANIKRYSDFTNTFIYCSLQAEKLINKKGEGISSTTINTYKFWAGLEQGNGPDLSGLKNHYSKWLMYPGARYNRLLSVVKEWNNLSVGQTWLNVITRESQLDSATDSIKELADLFPENYMEAVRYNCKEKVKHCDDNSGIISAVFLDGLSDVLNNKEVKYDYYYAQSLIIDGNNLAKVKLDGFFSSEKTFESYSGSPFSGGGVSSTGGSSGPN